MPSVNESMHDALVVHMASEVHPAVSLMARQATVRFGALMKKLKETYGTVSGLSREEVKKVLDTSMGLITEFYTDSEAWLNANYQDLVRAEEAWVSATVYTNLNIGVAPKVSDAAVASVVKSAEVEGTPLGIILLRQKREIAKQIGNITRGRAAEVFNEEEGLELFDSVLRRTAANFATITRSFGYTISQSAQEKAFEQTGLVELYQYNAILDTTTCPRCAMADGSLLTKKGTVVSGRAWVTWAPLHPNCRCFMVPVFKAQSQLTGKESETLFRNTLQRMDGKPVDRVSYKEWLQKQDDATLLKVLGPSKYKLWKAGLITKLSDLVTRTGRTMTVSQLRRKYAED